MGWVGRARRNFAANMLSAIGTGQYLRVPSVYSTPSLSLPPGGTKKFYSYWGIFWINASSDELMRRTYQDIAKVAGVGDNVRAAKYWLSNLKTQWLLIIDSADNSEIKLDDYIPDGERGHILITTRIPSNKALGTVGPQYLHFEGLKDDDANTLLLKAASKPVPGDTCSQRLAASITKALGSLPLAILHAGKAIMKRLCTLENYLQYYQIEKDNVRRARDFHGFQKGDNIYMNVYSSFEINFRGLQSKGTTEAQDAIQLLQMFSFFHCENIRMDFLIKVATNPKIEREEQEKEQAKQKAIPTAAKTRSWTTIFRDMALEVAMLIYKDRTPPVLPHLLRDNSEFERLGDFRLRAALNELTQLSLITYNEVNDNYSIHPVVHTWARERPEFSATEQAVWCQAATTALAQCILLPPLANGEADERLRHELLPHIDHVRERQREIRQRINEAQKSRKTTLFLSKPTMTRTQVLQLARFSRVYAQGGRWDEAKGLQLTVNKFCSKMLGDEHPSTMKIKLALSGTNWQLGQGNEAAELQNQVLQAYTASLGDDHPDTLKVMDVLGESRWQQGRYTDSEKLHERALKGMSEVLGPDHEDTLKAMDNLGRAHASHWRTEKARELHSRAATGMRKNSKLGPTHLETLTAVNNLAMTYMEYGGDAHSSESELQQAHQLLLEVIKSREMKLGKEHPYTLWAAANLARVKCAQGYIAEAESDILAGLKIVERNLGPRHIGTLFGKLYLGDILIKQKRLADAEEILLEVADGHRNMSVANKGEHPDRVKALDFLSTCYQLQDKLDEAIDMCGQAIDGLAALGGHAHPYMKRLRDKHMELCELRTAPRSKMPLRTMSVSEPPPPYPE